MISAIALFLVAVDPPKPANPTKQNRSEELRAAVRGGNLERVKALLDAGADVNGTVENGFTAIYFAENPKIVDLLLARGAKLDLRDHARLQTPLEMAAEHHFDQEEMRPNWRVIVKKLRDAGAEYTIDAAIYMDDVNWVKERLAKDATWVNKLRGAQMAPLRVAARSGRVQICKLLLLHGADPDDFEAGNGYPVIVEAVSYEEVVRLLIERKANLKRRITWQAGRSGVWFIGDEATVLHYAVQQKNPGSVKLLLDAGLDANAADDEGQTPLHLAVRLADWPHEEEDAVKQSAKIVQILLDHDASLELHNRDGKTALDLAAASKDAKPILDVLRKCEEQRRLDAEARRRKTEG